MKINEMVHVRIGLRRRKALGRLVSVDVAAGTATVQLAGNGRIVHRDVKRVYAIKLGPVTYSPPSKGA